MIRLNRPPRVGVKTLGYGCRVAIWLQGCTLACRGCASRDTWDAGGGLSFSVETLADLVLDQSMSLDGLTITGGEPFQQASSLLGLVEAVRGGQERSDFDILCFTGYQIGAARRRAPALVEALDVVVDGRFRDGQMSELPLRGSTNQKVHLLTDLAVTRYADIDRQPRPPLQFELTGLGLELIGIPRSGELDRLEEALAAGGLAVEGMSWR